MSTETKCPHCGAIQIFESQANYNCGTSVKHQNQRGSFCLRNEIQDLRQQLAERTGERDGARLNLKGPCELCWTCSWTPCPPETPNAVKDGENWIVCQCCEMKQQLAEEKAKREAAEQTAINLLRRAKEFVLNSAAKDCGPSCETKECRHDRARELQIEITAALEGKPASRPAEALLKEAEGVLERLADKASRYWDAPPDVEYPITVLLSTCRNAAALLAKIREGKK